MMNDSNFLDIVVINMYFQTNLLIENQSNSIGKKK